MDDTSQHIDDNQSGPSTPTVRFVRESGAASAVAALIEPVLEDMGFRLVRVVLSKREGATVQVMADKAGGVITIDDCAEISRRISPLLDTHDPIQGRYFLEVSSPGIDRILVRPSDFEDWAGYEARVELKELIDGRRRFKGLIEGYEASELRLEVQLDPKEPAQIIGLPIELIQEAKLVLTDELIRASLTRAKAQGLQWAEGGEIEDEEKDDGASRH